jgi:hypothetical protein
MAKFGQQLRVMHALIVNQGVPDRFGEILRGLDHEPERDGLQKFRPENRGMGVEIGAEVTAGLDPRRFQDLEHGPLNHPINRDLTWRSFLSKVINSGSLLATFAPTQDPLEYPFESNRDALRHDWEVVVQREGTIKRGNK